MSPAATRLGVGSRFVVDGDAVEVVEMAATAAGNEVVVKDGFGRLARFTAKELLFGDRARIVADSPGPSSDEDQDLAGVVLAQLTSAERAQVLERAEHVREVLTGYRAGDPELAGPGEPRMAFDPAASLMTRYAAKAEELGVSARTIKRWVAGFRRDGEAGLASPRRSEPLGRIAPEWAEMALEVMVEHTGLSRPTRKMVIERTAARLAARFGEGAVANPSRSAAYRVLEQLERRHPTFRLSTRRNLDVADRPQQAYGKLRPTRPGEYVLMDTTRLDVFALDPVTLRWVQVELTVAMDWYTRCITGIRLTPVSTKAVDAAAVLYQAYRPRPVLPDWPARAVWPEHGVPRAVLVDPEAVDGHLTGRSSPELVPETIVVDHGRVYLSEHLTSVCARMGISIQPVRLRTGRDKGPVERFFKTLREDLLQGLPGYKGPDLFSRGVDPEGEAFYFLDELDARVREWVAAVYHLRPHAGLIDPGVPGLALSPAQMFAHGVARAGYIEVPRDPDLGLEFLETRWRTIQPYGVEIDRRRYRGEGLPRDGAKSPYRGGRWPIQVDPDDITRVYFRDLERQWHVLVWEHAPSLIMPLSEEALAFARKLAAAKYAFPDDRLAAADLFERWRLGLGETTAERRMALRLSREQTAFDLPDPSAPRTPPSVRMALEASQQPGSPHDEEVKEGDDDSTDFEDDDFYAEALEDV
ncbi:transposase InsO family protein [Catenulispora sp. EB89]|uniref:helix-turn-helix domain-containing protein n=1 Tax=Catenulispora sp. EB89 TaxID=3156257 RepID=UPI0035183CA9